ncbi:MAG: pyrroloquinoline quinone biosynthesis protein PqqB [Polyangiaceae bacterium]|nr:pyrroloquinoline quinone biosynthesis protein PqqB [Polyangiaceae bacterium]
MRVHVLGSAAGGGSPQWNCACPVCQAVRREDGSAQPRRQESLAVDAGSGWLLLNASPEIRTQIESFEELHPQPPRRTPLIGVVLTNADLDHCLGLLSLREGTPLEVIATGAVRRAFEEENVLCRVLDQVSWRTLALGARGAMQIGELLIEAFPAPGKPPRYLEGIRAGGVEDNVGLRVRDARGRTLVYAPSVACPTPPLIDALSGADCVFFDGTFASSDELMRHSSSRRSAEEMAHLPVLGPEGSVAALAGIPMGRRVYIHLNNTNPMLLEHSPERSAVIAAGWEIASDGMDFEV